MSEMVKGCGLIAIGIALAVGFYSCNKYPEGMMDKDTQIKIEQEKTHQLELQLKLKNCTDSTKG